MRACTVFTESERSIEAKGSGNATYWDIHIRDLSSFHPSHAQGASGSQGCHVLSIVGENSTAVGEEDADKPRAAAPVQLKLLLELFSGERWEQGHGYQRYATLPFVANRRPDRGTNPSLSDR
jgi:hypothetical protein